ncbi:B-cell scaffold protein with ankyrin repeats-like [Hypanus sabinus]|uniref:B-cell scaffold protein with ankyrin repeats-like n=1 Tax=Hypanus sabinus TaxID=79690 RepID=UPI0028C40492|nr:B-cell scaffold protein with ankyrin repeats-like [Hypanus sabinus]
MERSGTARDSAAPLERGDVARRDVAILYGEDAGEWSVYLKDELLQHLDPEGVCSFQIGLLKDLQTAAHTLADYRCKFLVLTLGLLDALDNPRSQLLGKVLQPPAAVLLLLCGVPSSDDFYKVLPVESRFQEVSAEQEPWEYVSMVISIAESDPIPVPDLRPEMEVTEDLTDVLVNPDDFTEPLLVMPTQIPCENVTKIYLFLKDHLSLEERPEVEFVTGIQQIKVQASMLNSQTVCVRSVELPAGPVILKLHCRQTLLGSAQVIYFSPVEKIKRLLHKVTDPIQFICQAFQISTQTQLDELLTKSLQNSLPSSRIGAFQSIGTDSHSPAHYGDYECPTLLHFAAKNGLKRLTILLLDCPGAKQASALLNSHGEGPGEVAKRYGFQHIHELMDRFMESTQMVENQNGKWLEPSQGQEDEENIYEKMSGLLMAANKFEGVSKLEEMVRKEDPYTLSVDKEDQYTTGIPKEDRYTTGIPKEDWYTTGIPKEDRYTTGIPKEDWYTTGIPKEDRYTTGIPKEDWYTTGIPKEDRYTTGIPKEDWYTTGIPKEDRYTTAGPQKVHDTTAVDEEDPYTLVLGDDDHYTTARPKERCHTVEFDNNDYTTVVPKKDCNTTAVDEEDPYILVLGDDDCKTTERPKEDRYSTARPKERCHTVEFDNNDYTTVVPKKDRITTAVDEEDPYTLVLGDDDRNTTARPKERCHAVEFDNNDYTTVVPKKDRITTAVDEEDPYILVLGDDDRNTTARPKERCHAVEFDNNDYTTVVPKKDRITTAVDEEDPYILVLGDDDHNTTARPKERCHTVEFDNNDYTTVVPKKDRNTTAVEEEDPYILVLGDDDRNTTERFKEDTARPKKHCHTMAFDDDRYTTVVRKKHHHPAEADEEDPYTLTLDEDLCTTVVPKEGCYTMAEVGEVPGIPALGKEGLYDMVIPKQDRYTAAVTKRDCYARAVTKDDCYTGTVTREDRYTGTVTREDRYTGTVTREDRYTRTVTREDHYTVDNPYDYILPQRKSSSDARKESRPPAPIPRPVILSESATAPFIAQVFQQRTGREINENIYGIMARDMKTQRDRENIYSLAAPMRQAPGPPKLPNLYDKLSNVR